MPPPLSPALRGKNGKSNVPKPVVTLDHEASAQQRDDLLVEVAAISSFDTAAEWAKRIIPIKNTLTSEHARDVETALEVKLAETGDWFGSADEKSEMRPNDATPQDELPSKTVRPPDQHLRFFTGNFDGGLGKEFDTVR